jgi:hypothetical protein
LINVKRKRMGIEGLIRSNAVIDVQTLDSAAYKIEGRRKRGFSPVEPPLYFSNQLHGRIGVPVGSYLTTGRLSNSSNLVAKCVS